MIIDHCMIDPIFHLTFILIQLLCIHGALLHEGSKLPNLFMHTGCVEFGELSVICQTKTIQISSYPLADLFIRQLFCQMCKFAKHSPCQAVPLHGSWQKCIICV